MDQEWLGDEVAHHHPWVERCNGVLKDDLHVTPECSELSIVQRGDLPVLKEDSALCRFDQPKGQPPESRLAAAALTDKPHDLRSVDLERDVVDGDNVARRSSEPAASLGRDRLSSAPRAARALAACLLNPTSCRLSRSSLRFVLRNTGSSVSCHRRAKAPGRSCGRARRREHIAPKIDSPAAASQDLALFRESLPADGRALAVVAE